MNAVVLVIGDGLLANHVSQALSAQCQVERHLHLTQEVPDSVDLALVLDDGWNPSDYQQAEEVFQQANIPWLLGFVSFGQGIVGPLVRPGTPGCSQCADARRLMAADNRQELWALQQALTSGGGMQHDVWASSSALLQLTHLLVAEVGRVLGGNRAHAEGHVFLMNLKTFTTTRHFFLPDPQCAVCGHLPDDTPTAACMALEPSPKVSADSYRCRPLAELKGVLQKEYLDYRTGFLNAKVYDLVTPFATASVNLPLTNGDEGCAGRTHSYADSELTAILEGLERYCGLMPRGKRTVVRESYRDVADKALNPVRVGLHAKEQYAEPQFPFQPFHEDVPLDWVWGYSFLQERPILVPELLAYYSLGCRGGFVYETSNGCALGGSLVEAIFYGILEVVERDSFLLTWYAQLPLPRLNLHSAKDSELQMMVDTLRVVAGYDVHLFNATMENGIPSVWAVAKNRKGKGVNLICAAGAHLDPVRAVKGAIHELAGMVMVMDEKYEANKEECLQMYRNPFRVRNMEDHSMLYSLPQAEERLQFLLDERRPLRSFDEEFKVRPWHADLADDVKDILDVFRRLNLEVIVVDQTTPEVKRMGLHCVKVIIPGMLPMTFGYHLTRLDGLERVLRVPMELGYARKPLTREQLNPHPHPFP
ncbi:TOMM precursor leader peptide-binding protein [Alicyclobacillus pomorum]|uniref:TOMM precursor leader peptide-binding protein n=1 Tax=Alicyclobacillus pomorum TaxID=204470 RepID=UPI0004166111|nr:TOMM precursor leader peptide-binding protein [Alicyclobacillus pomorum]